MTNDQCRILDKLLFIASQLREDIKAPRFEADDLEQAIWKTRNKLADIIEDEFNVLIADDHRGDF